jgi:hypothetical protein
MPGAGVKADGVLTGRGGTKRHASAVKAVLEGQAAAPVTEIAQRQGGPVSSARGPQLHAYDDQDAICRS